MGAPYVHYHRPGLQVFTNAVARSIRADQTAERKLWPHNSRPEAFIVARGPGPMLGRAGNLPAEGADNVFMRIRSARL